MRWLIAFLLIALLAVAVFIACQTYYIAMNVYDVNNLSNRMDTAEKNIDTLIVRDCREVRARMGTYYEYKKIEKRLGVIEEGKQNRGDR